MSRHVGVGGWCWPHAVLRALPCRRGRTRSFLRTAGQRSPCHPTAWRLGVCAWLTRGRKRRGRSLRSPKAQCGKNLLPYPRGPRHPLITQQQRRKLLLEENSSKTPDYRAQDRSRARAATTQSLDGEMGAACPLATIDNKDDATRQVWPCLVSPSHSSGMDVPGRWRSRSATPSKTARKWHFRLLPWWSDLIEAMTIPASSDACLAHHASRRKTLLRRWQPLSEAWCLAPIATTDFYKGNESF